MSKRIEGQTASLLAAQAQSAHTAGFRFCGTYLLSSPSIPRAYAANPQAGARTHLAPFGEGCAGEEESRESFWDPLGPRKLPSLTTQTGWYRWRETWRLMRHAGLIPALPRAVPLRIQVRSGWLSKDAAQSWVVPFGLNPLSTLPPPGIQKTKVGQPAFAPWLSPTLAVVLAVLLWMPRTCPPQPRMYSWYQALDPRVFIFLQATPFANLSCQGSSLVGKCTQPKERALIELFERVAVQPHDCYPPPIPFDIICYGIGPPPRTTP
ncbi:uncharacterized protein VTP21DRAFT_10667 [Calcarisporiella thermophila]|uniref:uncharacterized protein n=1 Tax=Calcarisporiella thermophila TaxID=911321 RepID=UPI0037435E1A